MKYTLAALCSKRTATQRILMASGPLCATIYEYYMDVLTEEGIEGDLHVAICEVLKHNIALAVSAKRKQCGIDLNALDRLKAINARNRDSK